MTDTELRALIDAGHTDRATEEILRAYGTELIQWLQSMLPHGDLAYDAFSWLSEELWKSLPRWDGRCSIRTWCYMLARHAIFRVRRAPREKHELLVSQIPSIAHAVTHVWDASRARAVHERDVYAEIRDSLDEDDRTLLVLRVDRDLAWRDIAIVMLGEDADADALTKRAAALRKQFERVKQILRAKISDRDASE